MKLLPATAASSTPWCDLASCQSTSFGSAGIRFDVGSGERYPGQRVTATGVTAESDELSMKLASDQTTPVTLRFGGAYVVTLGEVGR